MVTTKHCSYGLCKSNSRYLHKDYMNGVSFIPFVKPKQDLEKCKRWAHACGRPNFSYKNVKKDTYICSKHFVGEAGPTMEHLDPIPATFTPEQVKKVNRWVCKVCGQKQSVLKEFGRGSGADCRRHVQKLNAARGAKMEEEAEHGAKMEEEAEHGAKMDAQALWSEANEEEQPSNKPVSRWDKYLPAQEEAEPEEAEPEESAVVMDRGLLSSRKQRGPKKDENVLPLRKRSRTEQDKPGLGGSCSEGPLSPHSPNERPRFPHPPNERPRLLNSSHGGPRLLNSPNERPRLLHSPCEGSRLLQSPRGGPRLLQSPSTPKADPTMVPSKTVSKWGAFLNKAPPAESGSAASALFQTGDDLDLTWTEDWSWT